MPVITHKFSSHQVHPGTELLILGTFNPDVPKGPDFFYGRPRNFLWLLLPGSWGMPSLKGQPLKIKKGFMVQHKIDFVDLTHTVNLPNGQESNVADVYIDIKVQEWKDVIGLMNTLPYLKLVCFTRKTFAGIPQIRAQIIAIKEHCRQKGIRFGALGSPARFANAAKQHEWINTIIFTDHSKQP